MHLELSKWIYVLILLRAKNVTVEEGTYNYRIKKDKNSWGWFRIGGTNVKPYLLQYVCLYM